MRKLFFIAAAATLPVVVLTACVMRHPPPTAVEVQLPCGQELVTNGSFEDLNHMYKPDPVDTFMTLFTGDPSISGWAVRTQDRLNGLAWSDNNNRFNIKTVYGDFFIDLTGKTDRELFPVIAQQLQ